MQIQDTLNALVISMILLLIAFAAFNRRDLDCQFKLFLIFPLIYYVPGKLLLLLNFDGSSAIKQFGLDGYGTHVEWMALIFCVYLLSNILLLTFPISNLLKRFDFLVIGSIGMFFNVLVLDSFGSVDFRFSLESLKQLVPLMTLLLIVSCYLASLEMSNFRFGFNEFKFFSKLIVLSLAIQIFEIFSQRAWSFTLQYDGFVVYRGAGLLVNPNSIAFISGLAIIFASRFIAKNVTLYIIAALLLISIFFSGSRSIAYLLICLLSLQYFFIRTKRHIVVLFLLLGMFILLPLLMLVVSGLFQLDLGAISLLGKRFYSAYYYVFNYIANPSVLPLEVKESLDGRFAIHGGGDSSWLALYRHNVYVFVLTLIGLLSLICLLAYSWRQTSDPRTFTGILAVLYMALAAFTMQVMIFPICIYVAFLGVYCFKVLRVRFINNY